MPDSTVHCLGSNAVGQLGRGALPLDDYFPAARVEGLTDVVQVEAGLSSSCARTRRGEVYCWGSNFYGQLGAADEQQLVPHRRFVTIPGDPHDRFAVLPIRVEGLPPARQLSVGAMHVCAIGQDARVYCWGANEGGQLGDGTTARRGTPVLMRGVEGAADVAASAYGPKGNTCVLMQGGGVKCVGRNGHGELGVEGVESSTEPVDVPGL